MGDFLGDLIQKFYLKNWKGRPRMLDIGSLSSDSFKKACQTTQHYP